MNPRPQTEPPASAADLLQRGHEPGPFVLALDVAPGAAARLDCQAVVRAIPGRRMVCRGRWQGSDVFCKLYLGNTRDWHAELRGLHALQASDIAAPRVLFSGTADHGAIHVILLEPVRPAVSFASAWEAAGDAATRTALLARAARTIAAHHNAGLWQADIHLDNFLLADDRLVTLDGGGIQLSGKADLPVKQSLQNLALFLAQFFPRFDALLDVALDAYRAVRSGDAAQFTADALRRQVRRHRQRRLRHFLKKVFRNCSAFACERDWRHFRVYDRSMASAKMLEFLADPDASLQHPEMRYLKQGNTCTLWLVPVDARLLVVKRYNIKGLAHRAGRAWRRSRAAVSWENAHRLGMYGIPTARPVALLEQRFGPLRGRAWYVSEYLGDEDITQLCRGQKLAGDAGVQATAQQVVALLAWLAECRISHGDMKGTNFILAQQGPAIIDLDAMREHACGWLFRRLQQRDLQRFMRNWDDCPDVAALFTQLMQNTELVADI
jgi:tRNA A-37 threonylcarbamoyl transferase component Bud32